MPMEIKDLIGVWGVNLIICNVLFPLQAKESCLNARSQEHKSFACLCDIRSELAKFCSICCKNLPPQALWLT